MQLLISPLAAQDLEDIGDYIAQDNAARAISFLAEFQTQCQKITNNPHGYRKRIELGAELRSCAHGNYVIFFTTDTHTVTIVRILHGSRDITQTSIQPTNAKLLRISPRDGREPLAQQRPDPQLDTPRSGGNFN